jgi:hypothetical protein
MPRTKVRKKCGSVNHAWWDVLRLAVEVVRILLTLPR